MALSSISSKTLDKLLTGTKSSGSSSSSTSSTKTVSSTAKTSTGAKSTPSYSGGSSSSPSSYAKDTKSSTSSGAAKAPAPYSPGGVFYNEPSDSSGGGTSAKVKSGSTSYSAPKASTLSRARDAATPTLGIAHFEHGPVRHVPEFSPVRLDRPDPMRAAVANAQMFGLNAYKKMHDRAAQLRGEVPGPFGNDPERALPPGEEPAGIGSLLPRRNEIRAEGLMENLTAPIGMAPRGENLAEQLMTAYGTPPVKGGGTGLGAAGKVSPLGGGFTEPVDAAGAKSGIGALLTGGPYPGAWPQPDLTGVTPSFEGETVMPKGTVILDSGVPVGPQRTGGGYTGGGEMANRIRNGLIDRGFPAHVAEGILKNMESESSLDPNAIGFANNELGLGQWNEDRATALQNFAQEAGTSWQDPNTQLDFLAAELGMPGFDPKWATMAGVRDSILSSETPQDAAVAWLNEWEKPAERYRAPREREYRAWSPEAIEGEAGPFLGSTLNRFDPRGFESATSFASDGGTGFADMGTYEHTGTPWDNIDWSGIEGRQRHNIPMIDGSLAPIVQNISHTTHEVFGDNAVFRAVNGQEDPGADPAGAERRHPWGHATDGQVFVNGVPVTPTDPKYQTWLRRLRENGATSVGVRANGYVHIDDLDPKNYIPGEQGPFWTYGTWDAAILGPIKNLWSNTRSGTNTLPDSYGGDRWYVAEPEVARDMEMFTAANQGLFEPGASYTFPQEQLSPVSRETWDPTYRGGVGEIGHPAYSHRPTGGTTPSRGGGTSPTFMDALRSGPGGLFEWMLDNGAPDDISRQRFQEMYPGAGMGGMGGGDGGYSGGGNRCPEGYVWDEEQQMCVIAPSGGGTTPDWERPPPPAQYPGQVGDIPSFANTVITPAAPQSGGVQSLYPLYGHRAPINTPQIGLHPPPTPTQQYLHRPPSMRY